MVCAALVLAVSLTTSPATGSPAAHVPSRAGLITLLSSQLEAVVGWPWDDPAGKPAHNTGGVIANALIDARAHVDSPAVWVTLAQYAHHLDAFYAADATRVPHMADITFLARVNDEKLAPNGMARARALFARQRAVAPTGADAYARLAEIRRTIPEILGYDVALTLDAARAVGETGYAVAMADAAVAAGHARLTNPDDSFVVTSVGALSRALMDLDPDRYGDDIVVGLTALERTQSPNGSWAVNNSQATAYAVAALRKAGIADGATVHAESWLIAHQRETGAWHSYDDGLPISRGPYIPLVQAEVLVAMLASNH